MVYFDSSITFKGSLAHDMELYSYHKIYHKISMFMLYTTWHWWISVHIFLATLSSIEYCHIFDTILLMQWEYITTSIWYEVISIRVIITYNQQIVTNVIEKVNFNKIPVWKLLLTKVKLNIFCTKRQH